MEATFNMDENIVQIDILFVMEKWGKLLLLDFFHQIRMYIILLINLYIFGLTLYICSSFP